MKKIFVLGLVVCAMFSLAGYLQAAGNAEHFNVEEKKVNITTTITGDLNLDKEKLPPFEVEIIPLRKFKHDAIIKGMADSKLDKNMISDNDHVIINGGSKKGFAEGDIVLIFKKGRPATERLNIDKVGPSMAEEEKVSQKEAKVATSIGDARVIKVESNSSVIQIRRCVETVEPGNFVKIKK